MNFQTAVEVFMVLGLLVAGVTTLAFRNRQNILIGFRVGYTYHSERVWRKVNTFAGVFSIVYSLFLLLLAFLGVSLEVFMFIAVAFVLLELLIGTWMAKREYELEELSKEAPEKPARGEMHASIRRYVLLQLAFLAGYLLLTALLWDRLPERIATHFNASGRPNGFSERVWGALWTPLLVWLLPFALTLPARDPGFFAKVAFYPGSVRAWCGFTTVLSGGVMLLFSLIVLYNADIVSSGVINYGVFIFLGALLLSFYRLLRVGKNGGV